MWCILVTRRFEKDFKRLNKESQKRVLERIKLLKANPFIGLPLRTLPNYYRLRVGKYRVIYKINEREHVIILLTIFRRKGKGEYRQIRYIK